MSIDTDFTGFKGDDGTRGSTWSSSAGVPMVTTDRLDGDQNLDTVNVDIYELQSGAWVQTTDLDAKNIKSTAYDSATGFVTFTFQDDTTYSTGDLRASSPTFDTNVGTTTIAAGNPGTASIDNTDPSRPILSLGLVSGDQGASGTAKSSPFIVNQPNDYVELDVDNLGTTASLEQSILDFSVSKFATGTGFTDTEGKRLRFISDNSSTSATGLLTGAGELGFSNYQINNSGTVADAVADIIAEIQHGYVVKAADGRVTGLTWQFSASLKNGTTDVIEFRDPDSDLTLTTALVTNFSPVWTSSNIDESLSSEYTTAGVVYSTGDFAHLTIEDSRSFFVCDTGFTTVSSNGTADFPGTNDTNWTEISPTGTGGTSAFPLAGILGVKSVLDIVYTKADYTQTGNSGHSITGFPTSFTDGAFTQLEAVMDDATTGIFTPVPRIRLTTLTSRCTTALAFLTDAASELNDPSVTNTDPDITTGEQDIDFFKLTATVIEETDTTTLRLTSEDDGAWASSTFTSVVPAGAATQNSGLTSVTLTTAGVVGSTTVAGDVAFSVGTFVVDIDVVYVCRLAYTSSVLDSRPAADTTHWKDISS